MAKLPKEMYVRLTEDGDVFADADLHMVLDDDSHEVSEIGVYQLVGKKKYRMVAQELP